MQYSPSRWRARSRKATKDPSRRHSSARGAIGNHQPPLRADQELKIGTQNPPIGLIRDLEDEACIFGHEPFAQPVGRTDVNRSAARPSEDYKQRALDLTNRIGELDSELAVPAAPERASQPNCKGS